MLRAKVYCIAALGSDGVIRLNDWGYTTAEDTRAARSAEDGAVQSRRLRS